MTTGVLPRARDWSATASVLTGCVALTIFYYFARADTIAVAGSGRSWSPMTGHRLPIVGHLLLACLLLGVGPAIAAKRLTRLSWSELGLGLGNWRQGLLLVVLGIPLAILAGKIGAGSPAMRAVYPLAPDVARQGFVLYALLEFLYYGSWEVLFRGVMLFATRSRFGDGGSNALQTTVSVTAHFGRALNETFAAFPAGLVFGVVALRLRSIWYVAVLHWLVGVSMEWFILHP